MKNIPVLYFLLLTILVPTLAVAKDTKIAVVQDRRTESPKYIVLKQYLKTKGFEAKIHVYSSYKTAASAFADGSVDIMFAGSGVAGCFIIKGLAYPVVRPISLEGRSTYSTVVIARAGSEDFKGTSDYFVGKKVACCELATSGEFFLRSIIDPNQTFIVCKTHTDALLAVQEGQADVAVIKNTVWEISNNRFPYLQYVGGDNVEYPNSTLMVSMKSDRADIEALTKALLLLESDRSEAAINVTRIMNIKGFIRTGKEDFEETLILLKAAGVTESCEFTFRKPNQVKGL